MNAVRRALAMLLLSVAGLTQAEPVNVVKFVNLSCAACRASETLDAPIRELAQSRGGRFVVAPLPRGQNDGRERMYYALRGYSAALETQVRLSLYKGAQDLNYPLADVPQTLDWLQTDLPVKGVDWPSVLAVVNGPQPMAAVDRAVRLAMRSGLQVVPMYVLVRGDEVLTALDAKSAPGGELPALREAVLNALRKAHAPVSTPDLNSTSKE